ncbi:hypothetical protein HYC85_016362 [Camellia sinensis]|uniref:Uncharacterized protein n=1 Tax=Camellia sinensis TaxID=4442 RepID=A0A7J7H2U0_CAMSI|nr:hypothetical protein HYC85_016362 [Camellia sinensis]
MADFEMPRVRLRIHGFEVSKLGYDCMGLSGAYNSLVSDEDGIAIIKYAFNIYGVDHSNEILVGKLTAVEGKQCMAWNFQANVSMTTLPIMQWTQASMTLDPRASIMHFDA